MWDEDEINQRNRQYRRLEMSKKLTPQYRLSTVNLDGSTLPRLWNTDKAYLEERGQEWVRLRTCRSFFIEQI